MAITLPENDALLKQQLEPTTVKPNKTRRVLQRSAAILTTALVAFYIFTQVPHSVENLQLSQFSLLGFALPSPVAPVTPTVTVFEVTPELQIPVTTFVSNTTLFNGSLTDGLTFDYEAPETFNYTSAILSLNFTNNALAASEPAVAEISVAGVPVWRTSTPYGAANTITTSLTGKNVTELLSLFSEDGAVEISVLEGSAVDVDIELVLSLVSETSVAAKPAVSAETVFAPTGPASVVVPLTEKVLSLPKDAFSVDLPQLNSNVSYAKVSVFASATEEEIAFYKQDIAKVGEPGALGPLRYINVYVNDIFVSAIAPKPTLFHANEITSNANASLLWQPLADSGAFEGLSYEVDLLPILPLLWAGEAKLSLEVVSPVSADTQAPGLPPVPPHPVVPGQGVITQGSWFISGKLLAWESDLVDSGVGEVVSVYSLQSESGLVVEPPAFTPWQPTIKNTIARSTTDSGIISQLNFTLVDNSTVNYTVGTNSSSHAILTKQSKTIKKVAGPPGSPFGSTTTTSNLVLISGLKYNYTISDTASGLALTTREIKSDFPLILNETAIDSNDPVKGPSSTDDVKLLISTDIKSKVNGMKDASYKIKEGATLDHLIGATTDIKLEISKVGELPYTKEVESTNGVITKDI